MNSSLLFISLSVMVLSLTVSTLADESPGFFLKITKNIPRLGRRSDKQFGNYFFKNAKQIPRIGRRNDMEENTVEDLSKILDEMSAPSKRYLVNPAQTSREYSVVQPVNANTLIELIEKDAIPSDNVKFVHWKDFDRALQADRDLYTKVVSLGRKPDRKLKEDLNFDRYMPFFGNNNQDDETHFYRGDNELYSGNDKDLLHYNEV